MTFQIITLSFILSSSNIFLQKHLDVAQVAEVKHGAVVDRVIQTNANILKGPHSVCFDTLVNTLPPASGSKKLTA